MDGMMAQDGPPCLVFRNLRLPSKGPFSSGWSSGCSGPPSVFKAVQGDLRQFATRAQIAHPAWIGSAAWSEEHHPRNHPPVTTPRPRTSADEWQAMMKRIDQGAWSSTTNVDV